MAESATLCLTATLNLIYWRDLRAEREREKKREGESDKTSGHREGNEIFLNGGEKEEVENHSVHLAELHLMKESESGGKRASTSRGKQQGAHV